MASESTTRWPLLTERLPITPAVTREGGRRQPRSVWLLIGLAFLCGGLVSAAGFSIGWRHQAQRNTATETALTAATTRVHALQRRVSALQTSLSGARQTAARAAASERTLVRAATRVGTEATTSSGAAASVSSEAGTLTASTGRIASELKTLDTYLTTTPAGQLDPGYIASQTAYLSRQLTKLEASGSNLGDSIASFQAAVQKLGRSASALSTK